LHSIRRLNNTQTALDTPPSRIMAGARGRILLANHPVEMFNVVNLLRPIDSRKICEKFSRCGTNEWVNS
jgi:hypothetical protein